MPSIQASTSTAPLPGIGERQRWVGKVVSHAAEHVDRIAAPVGPRVGLSVSLWVPGYLRVCRVQTLCLQEIV